LHATHVLPAASLTTIVACLAATHPVHAAASPAPASPTSWRRGGPWPSPEGLPCVEGVGHRQSRTHQPRLSVAPCGEVSSTREGDVTWSVDCRPSGRSAQQQASKPPGRWGASQVRRCLEGRMCRARLRVGSTWFGADPRAQSRPLDSRWEHTCGAQTCETGARVTVRSQIWCGGHTAFRPP